MKAKHARLLEDNTVLHADNTILHADNTVLHTDNVRLQSDNTRLAAQAVQAKQEAQAERQRSASLQSTGSTEVAAGWAAAQELQAALTVGRELREAMSQEQEGLAQGLRQALGKERERSRGLQGAVAALRESSGLLERRCAESEASLRRVCTERVHAFAASMESSALRSCGGPQPQPQPQPQPPQPPAAPPTELQDSKGVGAPHRATMGDV